MSYYIEKKSSVKLSSNGERGKAMPEMLLSDEFVTSVRYHHYMEKGEGEKYMAKATTEKGVCTYYVMAISYSLNNSPCCKAAF